MRNMAYIVTIDTIEPIEGKDRIVYIGFKENGYHVIGDKSFNIGDTAVYFEVDSILPVEHEFEFLRKRCYKENVNGFLIKNMKMCNKYSTGLLLHQKECGLKKSYKTGYDVSDIIGVRKYEPEEDASPKNEKNKLKLFLMNHKTTRWIGKIIFLHKSTKEEFPTWFIDKSDETNIQNHKDWFEKYRNIQCYVTTKMEGQSETIMFQPCKNKLGKFSVYSRQTAGSDDMVKLAKTINAEQRLKQAYRDTGHIYAIQGERCAPNVQKGIYKNGEHLYLYTVKDLTDNKLLDYESFIAFCDKYNFEHVPVISAGETLINTSSSLKNMQDFTEHQWFRVGESITNIDDRKETIKVSEFHRHEGIVVRGLNNEFSFKVKSNEYQIA